MNEPNLVDKKDNATEWDEPRLTLNYSHVEESLPGINTTYTFAMSTRICPIL